jgi:hypothetical protein
MLFFNQKKKFQETEAAGVYSATSASRIYLPRKGGTTVFMEPIPL